jgi:Rab proteins geranylgeranyltransferase component A
VKVAHLDNNPYYGGDEASLTLDELALWADSRSTSSEISETLSSYLTAQRTKFTSVSRSPIVPDHSRHYSISLAPSLIPSVGPLISSLIASGVSRYGGYRLLERVGIYSSRNGLQNVPGSKEDVFKSSLTLIEKRRLMRFLVFASGEFEGSKELQGHEQTPFPEFLISKFSLTQDTVDAIVYALAFCFSNTGLLCLCSCRGAHDNDWAYYRCDSMGTHPLTQLPPLVRPVRCIALPHRTLWWAWRDCTGFLSCLCSQWRRVYPG